MPASISHLPSELCVFVSNFLTVEDWTNFLNCGKSVDHIKRETRYLLLNFELSGKYCSDETFRNLVNSKIRDRRRQMCLSLDNSSDQLDLSHVQGAHRVILNNSDRETLDGVLQGISELTLLFCEQLRDVSSLSADPFLKRLQLYMCPAVETFGFFTHLESIVICENKIIKDLSPLRDVKSIRLTGCSELRDLGGLAVGRRQHVSLVACLLVEDVSPLQHCERVDINGCHNLKSIMPLLEVPSVSVEYCRGFTDSNQISTFQQRPKKTFRYIPFKEQ